VIKIDLYGNPNFGFDNYKYYKVDELIIHSPTFYEPHARESLTLILFIQRI